MHYAAIHNHPQVCEWLFQNGIAEHRDAMINAKSQVSGLTPLHFAADKGHMQVCEVLLKLGAAVGSLHEPMSLAHTPLFLAARGGHLDVCELLLSHVGETAVSEAGWDGLTPLHVACREGHLAIAQWLCSRGAAVSVNEPTEDDELPIHCALSNGHLHVCDWLYRNWGGAGLLKCRGYNGLGAVHFAVVSGSVEMATWVLEHGCDDVNETLHVRNPMCIAAAKGHLRMCQWLFENGGHEQVNLGLNGGSSTATALGVRSSDTPLRMAASNRKDNVVEWVLKHRAPDAPVEDAAEAFGIRHYQLNTRLGCLLLRKCGGRLVKRPMSPEAPDEVLELAVRVGAELRHMRSHPRLMEVLLGAFARRRGFIRAFLFGCLRRSGSTNLWRIGSRYAQTGLRRDVALYLDVVVDAQELRNLAHALRVVTMETMEAGDMR